MTDEQYKVYLAGPVRSREDNGQTWREETKDDSYPFAYLDPLAKYSPDSLEQWTPAEIVENDLQMLREADGVLVRYEGEPTWGTPMEVFYAASTLDIPVSIVWCHDETVSPWAQHHADYISGDVPNAKVALDQHFADGDDLDFAVAVELYDDASEDMAPDDDGDDDADDADSDSTSPESEDHPVHDVDMSGWGETPTTDEFDGLTGDELAALLATDTAATVNGSRDSHGDAVDNQEHIADAWTWYLRDRLESDLTGADVCAMMTLLKLSRSVVGEQDLDHYRDVAGYAAIAGACLAENGATDIEEITEHLDEGDIADVLGGDVL